MVMSSKCIHHIIFIWDILIWDFYCAKFCSNTVSPLMLWVFLYFLAFLTCLFAALTLFLDNPHTVGIAQDMVVKQVFFTNLYTKLSETRNPRTTSICFCFFLCQLKVFSKLSDFLYLFVESNFLSNFLKFYWKNIFTPENWNFMSIM